jgi:hypothetical protein
MTRSARDDLIDRLVVDAVESVVVEMRDDVLGIDQGDDAVERDLTRESSSMKNVAATGLGSASPLVSTRMWSNFSRRLMRLPRMRMRSVRTLPRSRCSRWSSRRSPPRGEHQAGVDVDLAELVLDHRDAVAVRLGEDVVEQRGLARARKPERIVTAPGWAYSDCSLLHLRPSSRPPRASVFSPQRLQHILRRDRVMVEAHADGIVHGVGDGGADGDDRVLAHALGAERAAGRRAPSPG